MDNFETRLKSIPLARPSEMLYERIFARQAGGVPSAPGWIRLVQFRIPLGWAALFAILTTLAGMFAARLMPAKLTTTPGPTVNIHIVKAASDRNLFDFTESAAGFAGGELTVDVQTRERI